MASENPDLKTDAEEPEPERSEDGVMENETDAEEETSDQVEVVGVYENRPEGYDGSCLRPLGFCDLGGCCDVCWYRPDNPNRKTN